MRIKRLLILIIAILSPVLGGCAGKSEIDELGYVMGIGIDLGQKPGYYSYTYQFAEPQTGEGGVQIQPLNITVEARSSREARMMVSQIINRNPFIGTTRVIVIGEEAAKTGIEPIIEAAHRYYEFRRTLYLVIAKGKAEDLLNLELKTGNLVSLHIAEIIEQSREVSRVPITRLGHFLTVRGTEGKEPLIALIEVIEPEGGIIRYQSDSGEPENLRMSKSVGFKEDRLKLVLTEQETEGALYLLNEVEQKILAVNDGERFYAGTMLKSSTKTKLISQDGRIGVEYTIKATMDLEEIRDEQFKSYQDTLELIKRAEAVCAKVIEESCQKAIQRAKAEQIDFVGLGRTIQIKNNALWQELKQDWESRLPGFPVIIKAEVKVRNIGTSYQSPGTNR